jgi:hypothetical protein
VVNAAAIRIYRLMLLAYPRRFRRHHGDDMVRTLIDQHRFGARSASRILLHEAIDTARTASRMRTESPMTRTIMLAVAGTAAVAALVAGAPLVLLPAAAIGLVAWSAGGNRIRPIAPTNASPRRRVWLASGGLAVAVAVAIPAIDGGELDQLWWSVMAVCLLGGITMMITGLLLGINGPRA